MKRLIIDKILAWDESASRKPLILMGARQVGKTWLMEEFARRRYAGNTVAVNFMKNERLRLRFETADLDPDSIIEAISIETGQKIVPGKTLQQILLDGDSLFTHFKGALTEQYVLEELSALGVSPYYWSPDNAKAEVEFLLQIGTMICPVVPCETCASGGCVRQDCEGHAHGNGRLPGPEAMFPKIRG